MRAWILGHKGGSMRALSGASLALGDADIIGIDRSRLLAGRRQFRRRRSVQGGQPGVSRRRTTRRRPSCTRRRSRPTRTSSQAYFYLGNSYDNQYQAEPQGRGRERRAARQGGRELPDGVREAAAPSRTSRQDARHAGRSSILSAAYGADKLNDPAKAEPVVQKMIQLEPSEPSQLLRARARSTRTPAPTPRPSRRFSERQGRQAERPGGLHDARRRTTTARASSTRRSRRSNSAPQVEPNNPEAFQTIASYYWDETAARRPAERHGEARLRPEGARGGRQGARAQDRLRRGA